MNESPWTTERQAEYDAYRARKSSAAREDRRLIEVSTPHKQVAPTVSLLEASSITPEPIRWLWPGYLARGKAHILGGQPGTGKTTIAMRVAATVSTGDAWPDGGRCKPGNVVIWSGEDDPGDTLIPRLIASGADRTRIRFVDGVNDETGSRSFDPSKDIVPLREAIHKAGGAALVIVDPVVSAVAGDSHKNADVRRALQPLVDLCAELDAALLGITHFSKGTAGRDPVERITGSLAFGALARVVMVAAKKDPEAEGEKPERIFCRAKSNIGLDDGGFSYDLRQEELREYPGVVASAVEWLEAIEGSARDLLGEAEDKEDAGGGTLADARAFLSDLLADGPQPMREIKQAAEAHGHSWRTVERAKSQLGVVAKKRGLGGGWEWDFGSAEGRHEGRQNLQESPGFLEGRQGRQGRQPEDLQSEGRQLSGVGGLRDGIARSHLENMRFSEDRQQSKNLAAFEDRQHGVADLGDGWTEGEI